MQTRHYVQTSISHFNHTGHWNTLFLITLLHIALYNLINVLWNHVILTLDLLYFYWIFYISEFLLVIWHIDSFFYIDLKVQSVAHLFCMLSILFDLPCSTVQILLHTLAPSTKHILFLLFSSSFFKNVYSFMACLLIYYSFFCLMTLACYFLFLP